MAAKDIYPIILTCAGTLAVNIPFGYWRAGYKKLSPMWFLFIHLPVPLVIVIRSLNHIRLSWTLAPFLFASYFTGQWIGKKWRRARQAREARKRQDINT